MSEIEKDYLDGNLAPPDLKLGISDWLINFLAPIKQQLNTDKFNELVKKAYE